MDNCTNNCSSVPENVRFKVGIVGIVSCSFSLLGCLFVVAIVVIYKKYVFSIQRLILYMTVSVFGNALGQLAQRIYLLHSDFSNDDESTTCQIAGFVSQYTVWGILLSLCCMMFELLLGVFRYIESGMRLHLVYAAIIFVLPLTVNWIPFVAKAYGPMLWTCEIITHKCCEKYTEGIILGSVLWWVPLYATLVYMIIGYIVITAKLVYDKKRYTAMLELNRNQVYRNTYDDIMYLKYYPIIYMLINVLPIVSNIYDIFNQENPGHQLWVAVAFIKGIQGGIITVLAVLDPKTRKRLSFKNLKMAFLYNVMMKEAAEDYPIINSKISDSLHPNPTNELLNSNNNYYT